MPLRIAKSGASIATFRIIDIDNDAFTFLTAAGITNTTQRNAINKLVIDLKYYGLWTKQRAIYPVVGGVAASHAVNLKTPGTYNLTFTAGWTHSSTGMTPNGTSDYANTGLTPSSVLTLNNVHLSYYSRTNQISLAQEIGSGDNRTNFPSLVLTSYYQFSVSQIGRFYAYDGGAASDSPSGNTTNTNSIGFYIGTRTSSTSAKFVKNSTIIGTNTSNSIGVQPNYPIWIGGQNYLGGLYAPTTKQCAFASIGDGLTDQDALNFYNIVQQYQTNLGRQV